MGMSWTEIGLLLLVGVILFGGSNRLPEIVRSFGRAMGELKQGIREGKEAATPDNDIDPTNAPSYEEDSEQGPTT